MQLSSNKVIAAGKLNLCYLQSTHVSTHCISVDLRISGFVLVLHLPYLLRIQRFFTDNLPKQPEAAPPQSKTKEIVKPKVWKNFMGIQYQY